MVKIKLNKKNLKIRSILIGISATFLIFFVFGIVTVLIKNPFFARMTPVYWYDYAFLVLTALHSGAYIGLWHYNKNNQKNINSRCYYAATGGAVGGFFSFGCAICNKLLIWILGLSGVIAYFMPIKPMLGIISVILLGYAVYFQLKILLTSNNQTKTNFIHYNYKEG